MRSSLLILVVILPLVVQTGKAQFDEPITVPKDDFTVQRFTGGHFTMTGGELPSPSLVEMTPVLVLKYDSTFSIRLNVVFHGDDWIFFHSHGGLELRIRSEKLLLDGNKPLRFVRGYHSVTEEIEFAIDRRDLERFILGTDIGLRLVSEKGTYALDLPSDAIDALRAFYKQYEGMFRDTKEIHYRQGL